MKNQNFITIFKCLMQILYWTSNTKNTALIFILCLKDLYYN